MFDLSVRRSLIGAAVGLCGAALLALPQAAAAKSPPAVSTALAASTPLDHLWDPHKGHGGPGQDQSGDGGGSSSHGSSTGQGSGSGSGGDGNSKGSGDGKPSVTGTPGKATAKPPAAAVPAPAAPRPHTAPKPVTVTTSATDPAPFSPAPDVSHLTAQPVESLGALTGISFGGGVVLWPLLAALDAVGLALIVRSHLRRRRATAED